MNTWRRHGRRHSTPAVCAIMVLAQVLVPRPAQAQAVTTLTVVSDLTGPKVLTAIGDYASFGSNSINVTFSERVTSLVVRDIENYTLTRMGTSTTVTITNIVYSTALGALLYPDVNDPDWLPHADYILTLNNVTDTSGNVIAPNTRIAVSWPRWADGVRGTHSWRFHNSWFFDPDPVATNWYACDYLDNFLWGTGVAPFCDGLFPSIADPDEYLGCRTQLGFQIEPVLFRTWFHWPTNLPTTNVSLDMRFVVDDGAVFYLNGEEFYRYNVSDGPLNFASRAATGIWQPPSCPSRHIASVGNLVSGSNCIAVAVLQGTTSGYDFSFFLEFDVDYLQAPALPLEPHPALNIASLDTTAIRLSWAGSGYALESSTNLALGPLSYPQGPWTEVPQLSNPYIWSLTNGLERYFRLKK